MAIRFPCGAKHRPAPKGPERERIATALTGFAMTVVFVMLRTRSTAVGYRPPLSLRGGRSPTWQSASSCGAKHRPAPKGPERERIATALTGFAMTVVFVMLRTRSAAVGYRPPLSLRGGRSPTWQSASSCGAKHRPAPKGPKRERIATALRPRNDSAFPCAVRLFLERGRFRCTMSIFWQIIPARPFILV